MIKKHFTDSEQRALKVLSDLEQLACRHNQHLLPVPRPSLFIRFKDMITGPIYQSAQYRWKTVRTIIFISDLWPIIRHPFVVKVHLWRYGYKQKGDEKCDELPTWEAERVVIGWLEVFDDLGPAVVREQQFPWPNPVDGKGKLLREKDTTHYFDNPISLKEYILI